MIQNDFNKIFDYCDLTKNDNIKNEVTELLKGYNLYDIKLEKDGINCFLKDGNDNKIELSAKKDSIKILKTEAKKQELITIASNLDIKEKSLEKRPNGVIFSVVSKKFRDSSIYNNRSILSHLIEQRYTFIDDTLNSYFKNISFSELFKELVGFYENADLECVMDYYSIFEIDASLSNSSNSSLLHEGVKTYLNGEDLENTYNIFNSPTIVYRIYDLYRGLITPINESDINLIHNDHLSDKVFNLRELYNLTFEEDNLVGPTTIPISKEYYEYVKKFLSENYGYFGEVAFDRDTLLSAITYKKATSELTKRDIEETSGMSYEDFIKHNTNKLKELARQVTHKKKKPSVLEKETDIRNLNGSSSYNPLKKTLKFLKK